MIKQYLYISLFVYIAINISFVLTDPVTSVNNGTSNQTPTPDNKIISSENETKVILTEGGKIELHQNISHQEREHVHVDVSSTTIAKNNVTASPQLSSVPTKSATTATTPSTKATEEKPVTENHNNSEVPKNDGTVSSTQATELKPVTEIEFHGDSKVKPRKGVTLNDSVVDTKTTSTVSPTKLNSTVSSTKPSTTTTTTSKPRKPTVTFGSDEEDPPSRLSNTKLFSGGKQIEPKNQSSSTYVSAVGEQVFVGNTNRPSKGSAYVLPIVLTILAVPLLAIILTVVYKRGAEWWSHRHYRRMDFLIDGMYNN